MSGTLRAALAIEAHGVELDVFAHDVQDAEKGKLPRYTEQQFQQLDRKLNQVYQRLMQIGDVDFDTAATDDYNFVFYGVADPGEVVHAVDQATGGSAAGTHGLGEAQPPRA